MQFRMSSLLLGPGGGKWAMQRTSNILLAGIFLFSSIFARAQQASSNSGPAGNQSSPTPTQDCSRYFDQAREAIRNAQLDRRALVTHAESAGAPQMNRAAP